MSPTAVRLVYDDADATDSMRRDAEAAGRRLGVGREAMLDRAGDRRARTDRARRRD